MKELLNFRRYRLDNGLRVLILEDRTLPVVSFQVHFAAGSRYELPGVTGISHLFEHMMFRGTSKLGPEEFSKIIQSKGGVVNAFTTFDHTTYWENIPSKELDLVVELEAHRLKELRITEESLATELEVVRSERKMRIANTPYGAALEELFSLAYLRHPYRWPVIGWDQDLRRLTVKDCLEYFRRRYTPCRAVIVVAGDVDPERTLKLIEQHYADLVPFDPGEEFIEVEPPQRGKRTAVFKKRVELEAFFWAFHVPGIESEYIYPLILLNYILSIGKTSRFWKRFVKNGSVTELKAQIDPLPFWPKDPALFIIYGIASPRVPLQKVENEVWEELWSLKDNLLDDEVKKAQRLYLNSLWAQLESIFFRALMGGIYEVKTGDFRKSWEIEEKISNLTKEDVIGVIEQYFREDNCTRLIVEPITAEEEERFGLIE